MNREELGALAPRIVRPVPGAASQALVDALARTECPALTTRRARRQERSGAPQDPIVWREARGANVVDADGNVFVDLVAGFGVSALGHAHPAVVHAIREQSGRLVHAMGDVCPSDVKIELCERLASIAPFPDARVILGAHGADAIEAALKTALLRTRAPGVLAFEGGYHGLAHGPLAICGYSPAFRAPFAAQLSPHVTFAPWPRRDERLERALDAVERAWAASPAKIGAVVVEPIQGRGGVRVPPPGFLEGLSQLAEEWGALVIVDEIWTGLGRTGARWASEARADLVCIGKALGGGMPISACLGRDEVMSAWGDPSGEAIHTATFFGHPIACAAALATLDAIDEERVADRARDVGARWAERLRRRGLAVRGRGLALGIEVGDGARTLRLVSRLSARGWITLPAGASADVLQLSPPLTIDEQLLHAFEDVLEEELARA